MDDRQQEHASLRIQILTLHMEDKTMLMKPKMESPGASPYGVPYGKPNEVSDDTKNVTISDGIKVQSAVQNRSIC